MRTWFLELLRRTFRPRLAGTKPPVGKCYFLVTTSLPIFVQVCRAQVQILFIGFGTTLYDHLLVFDDEVRQCCSTTSFISISTIDAFHSQITYVWKGRKTSSAPCRS